MNWKLKAAVGRGWVDKRQFNSMISGIITFAAMRVMGCLALFSVLAGLLVLSADASRPLLAQARVEIRPPGFVDAADVVPGLVIEMRYAGPHNFVGTRIDGYDEATCLLTKEAANALERVQLDLASSGVGLKALDCYRPERAVAHFVRWASDLADIATKSEFYPDLDKRDLLEDGYIAARSSHSRGSAVDLTLVQILSGPSGMAEEVDMGTQFDVFSPRAWPSSRNVSEEAFANRELLASAMAKGGFKPSAKEWWHFTLVNEPFPNTTFDFPVR